jgi:hypothetical protein
MTLAPPIHSDEWVSRIGVDAATFRRRRRRATGWALGLAVTVPLFVVGMVAIASRSGSGPAPADDFVAVTGIAILTTFVLVASIAAAAVATQNRCRMEGAALRVLRPANPTLGARDLGRHTRSVSAFDAWAREASVPAPQDPAAEAQWTPDVVRPMLAGPTARGWFAAARWAAMGMAAFAVVGGLVGLILSRGTPHPVAGSMFAVVVVGLCVVSGVLGIIGLLRVSREYNHGYVTTVASSRSGRIFDYRVGVDLVDPRTGYVIRPACAASLDTATYQARLQTIRATHPRPRPQRLP